MYRDGLDLYALLSRRPVDSSFVRVMHSPVSLLPDQCTTIRCDFRISLLSKMVMVQVSSGISIESIPTNPRHPFRRCLVDTFPDRCTLSAEHHGHLCDVNPNNSA